MQILTVGWHLNLNNRSSKKEKDPMIEFFKDGIWQKKDQLIIKFRILKKKISSKIGICLKIYLLNNMYNELKDYRTEFDKNYDNL